jgi:hypothetical protein
MRILELAAETEAPTLPVARRVQVHAPAASLNLQAERPIELLRLRKIRHGQKWFTE